MTVLAMLAAIAWTGISLGLLVFMIETVSWVGIVFLGLSSLLGMCTMLYGGAIMLEEFERNLGKNKGKTKVSGRRSA